MCGRRAQWWRVSARNHIVWFCPIENACVHTHVCVCVDRDAIIIVGSVITALYALVSGPIASVDSTQLIYLSAQCLVFIPLAYAIITIAPRFTSSAEVQLVFLLESILGPLWVWIVISETPPFNTIIGGSLLLASVFWFAIDSVGKSANEVDDVASINRDNE